MSLLFRRQAFHYFSINELQLLFHLARIEIPDFPRLTFLGLTLVLHYVGFGILACLLEVLRDDFSRSVHLLLDHLPLCLAVFVPINTLIKESPYTSLRVTEPINFSSLIAAPFILECYSRI